MFKPGSILEVSFKNFVTYQEGAVYPGPRLNMVIGPNGTGKSTVVAAIILGLGGNPKIVGRGSKISEYVKSNCDDSKIKIILKGHVNKRDVVVERHFNKFNKSLWYIDGQLKIMPEVLACISTFNIQVNNLCQFLPQDKVQDFAKMTKQELLKQTLVALCRQDLVDIQSNLIDMGKKQRLLFANVSNFDNKVGETQGLNARLESKMKNIELHKQLESELIDVKRKISWVQYDAALQDYRDAERDRNRSEKNCEFRKQQLAPYKKNIEDLEANYNIQNAKCTEEKDAYKKAETDITKNSSVQERLMQSLEDIQEEKEGALRMLEEREIAIQNYNVKIRQLEHEKELIHQHNDPEGGITRHIATLESEQSKVQRALRSLEGNMAEFERELRNIDYENRALSAENERIASVTEKRLQWLQGNNRHAYEGAIWLRENGQGRFKGKVYGPMMLELNVVDPKYCKFLESTIPYQDRIAFTCELKEDMNALLRILRSEKRLSVNVVHSAVTDKPSSSYQPQVPIEQLRKYGLYAYLNTVISGPEPIMRYILKNHRLHDVPIGNDATNKQYQEIAKQVPFFYSGEYCFKKSGSRYDKSYSSIIQRALGQDSGSLAITVNTRRIAEIRGKLEEVAVRRQQSADQINDINGKVADFKNIINVISNKLKDAHKIQEQCRSIDFKLNQLVKKTKALKTDAKTADAVEEQFKRKIMEAISKLAEHQRKNLTCLQALKKASLGISLMKAEILVIRTKLVHAENNAVDTQGRYDEAKGVFAKVEDGFRTAGRTAKDQLRIARNLSDGLQPAQDGFNQFRPAFDELPSDLYLLETKSNMLQARIDCTTIADENEIREFEKRNQQIDTWLHERERVSNDLVDVEEKISESRLNWLQPLSDLIDKISTHFAAAFEKMGCAGEVAICTGGQADDVLCPPTSSQHVRAASPIPSTSQQSENLLSQTCTNQSRNIDYSLYGIAIRVTYRNGEPLQELNTVTQSGGERSVATAAYMLSLQTLTPVPFRCVDEINQGMDSTNEERVFDLLVDCTMGGVMNGATGGAATSQYFLITPKLNQNLQFVNGMKIHFVHNGPHAVKQRKWKLN